ncbi:hydrogen gas-evolving membrane-bound hydrogenase subunit E [Pseudonocardia sp.]|uniref:hydrogen gas-evolving membrane-bound hydrogenase subunit E n=1 Tax=Pseudonocardia sp. TaxID=60912 RepID=UPI002635E0AA|nr:hydrogen gas-evolving membrane-bound hydrogenase subunit E [Pseudonocardia sp.]
MLALVVAHLVVAGLLPLVSARSRRAAFAVAAVLPAGTVVWALAHVDAALEEGVTSTLAWAPSLGLELSFRLDALALAMIVLVSGLGAVILVYSVGYFGPRSEEATRSAALLLTFAGVMLGLVLADDLLTLYVFWELTSITSYLLVGQSGEKRESRRAALQALLVTVLGGLSMLLGFVLLGEAAGTYRISEILADPPSGGLVTAALPLILLGAFTKSAQLPFHPWLPAAMVAPTPVSAYLHAASMVKAGVYLVARLSPAFAEVALWWVPVVVAGIATMLIGGWRALAETDLKRVLAFGTVSQLGFLMVLFGAGGRIAALAGIAMLLAHGLFKAPLFMIAGAVDHATGTRDLRRLSGLRVSMPGLAVAAALAGASMAGLPPLIGFVGKEAAFEAFLHEGGARGWIVALGLLVGSVLTAAYTARFLWGAFARKPGVEDTPVHAPGALLTGPIWLCAGIGLALGVAFPLVDALAAGYAGRYVAADAEAADYHLALWHGLKLPLLFSVIVIVGGLLLHRYRGPLRTLHDRSPLDAQRGYETTVGALERIAVVVTGRLQVGSLPAYLGTILAVVVLFLGPTTLLGGVWPDDQRPYHDLAQVPLAAAVILAALAALRAKRRFSAVLLVGIVGYGVGGLFVVDGAPDLALAQFLVETLSLVAFVFVLRRLPAHFTEQPSARRIQLFKAALATAGGLVVAGVAVVLSGARVGPASASDDFIALAPDEAGADNVIAAILVDFRAMDTVGEISVLFVAAAGVASLVLATRYDRRGPGGRSDLQSGQGSPQHEEDVLG